jgi:endonuclease I
MRAALRRSREQDAGVNIDRSDWKALIDLFEVGTCIYCGTDGHKLTMDHWMPVSLGGKTEVGNLIPCCKSCNSRKSNMHPIEWMKKAGINDDRGSGSITILEFLELTREAVIDVKGMDTPLSKFKRKCVKAQYGFDVEIVK